ncbi:MAG: S-layer homology domain-containing protein [Clostridiales bacterium]|nr:S-layer homology domain-containing protein [Clostridiales bacterium]
MGHKRRIVIITMLIILLIANSFAVYSQGLVFTDIEGHWAREYIEKIYNLNITSGYADATFRPNNSITGLETVAMASNLIGFDEGLHNYENDYVELFSEHGIPEWAKSRLAYLMVEEIIKEDELEGLIVNKTSQRAKRYEVANLIGRVLVNHADKSTRTIFSLPYKDEMFIPSTSRPYVDLMLVEGLLNSESNEGRFLPNDEITRAEVAKLVAIASELLDVSVEEDNGQTKQNEQDEQQGEDKTETIEAVLSGVVIANRSILTVFDDMNKQLLFDIHEDVVVEIDGEEAILKDLVKGQIVNLTIINGQIKEISAEENNEVINGYFRRFIRATTRNVLSITREDGTNETFIIPDGTIVRLNDREDALANFEEGDVVKIIANAEFVLEVEGRSKVKFIEGTITAKGTLSNPYIEIMTEDNGSEVIVVEENSRLTRDGRITTFAEIRISDEIKAELVYEKLIRLNASTVKRDVKGLVRRIVIGEQSFLMVETKDGVREEFEITENTFIEIDDRTSEIYDLRLSFNVELKIESNEVMRVITSAEIDPEIIRGEITFIHDDIGKIEISKSDGTIMQISVTSKTIYIGEAGERLTFRSLSVGDEISIRGTSSRGVFIADRIVIDKAN